MTNENEIDIKIKDFNIAYEKYSNLISNNPKIDNEKYIDRFNGIDFENKHVKKFRSSKIYFLRVVRRKNEKGSAKEYGFINIMNEEIKIPKDLINLFVFCALDLKSKTLSISTELDNGSLNRVKSIKFKIENIIY